MPKPTWPRSKTLRFIQVYKSLEFLWNPAHIYYLDKNKRHNALEEMARIFDTSKHVVERKIMDLQTNFGKEIKKMKRGIRGEGDRYISKWFALKALTFLLERRRRYKWVRIKSFFKPNKFEN